MRRTQVVKQAEQQFALKIAKVQAENAVVARNIDYDVRNAALAANKAFAIDLIEVADRLEITLRSSKHSEMQGPGAEDVKAMLEGVRQIDKSLQDILHQHGLERHADHEGHECEQADRVKALPVYTFKGEQLRRKTDNSDGV